MYHQAVTLLALTTLACFCSDERSSSNVPISCHSSTPESSHISTTNSAPISVDVDKNMSDSVYSEIPSTALKKSRMEKTEKNSFIVINDVGQQPSSDESVSHQYSTPSSSHISTTNSTPISAYIEENLFDSAHSEKSFIIENDAGQQLSLGTPVSSYSSTPLQSPISTTNSVPISVDIEENMSDSTHSEILSTALETSRMGKSEENSFIFNKDPATWVANEFFREYVALNGFDQNKTSDFQKSKKNYPEGARYLNPSLFTRHFQNGELGNRAWLVYSESKGSVFCAPCMLFGDGVHDYSFVKEGFNDWKNCSRGVSQHENSSYHKQCVLKLNDRANTLGRVDHLLAVQLKEEISYWREVLKRVVATIKTLSSRGLSFRGTNEHFGCPDNGNFLMLLEYLRQFDPFLDEHIRKYGDQGSGSTSYLSKTIYEEIMAIMAKKVLFQITEEVKAAKYYSIIVDSTPDMSHVDQLSFILRYVKPDGTVVERFLTLLNNIGHKGKNLYDAVTSTLKLHGIDINNMRGQSYDNAANMKGIYSGLQARIKKDNPLAEYTPCTAHSLNLVGTHAAESCQEAMKFFELVQELYNFFSESTDRWAVLLHFADSKFAKLKSLSTTRWSARADAVNILVEFWTEIISALLAFEENPNEKSLTRNKAIGLRKNMERLESAFMLSVWSVLLQRFDATSQKLQQVNTSIADILDLYKSLIALIENTRENFESYEEAAKKISTTQVFEKDIRRKKKRKSRFDESDEEDEVELSGRDDFRVNTFNAILDKLNTDLRERYLEYENIFQKFRALIELGTLNQSELRKHAITLQKSFPNDLESTFVDELVHFQEYCKVKSIENDSPRKILEYIRKREIWGVFPNVDIAYRLFNCTEVSNCSAERSFSCLKRIKNYLSTTTTQDRLNCQMILAIESELASNIDFNIIIEQFAEQKARRKILDTKAVKARPSIDS